MGSGSSRMQAPVPQQPRDQSNGGPPQPVSSNGIQGVESPRTTSALSSQDHSRPGTAEGRESSVAYPPPAPPGSRKNDVFSMKEHAALDKRVTKLTNSDLYGTWEELADLLTAGCTRDVSKARAIFRWMTSIDLSTLQSNLEKLPAEGTPLDYLLRIHWQMGNHAHFFAQLARSANLPCVIVTGINKSAAYQLGSKINKATMSAQWNALYLDGDWRFVDVFWASTCVVGRHNKEWSLLDMDGEEPQGGEEDQDESETLHQVNEFFFLPDPDELIHTHYPDYPEWQLMKTPVTIETFEKRVYIRERYHQLDLKLLEDSHMDCFIHADNGHAVLSFGLTDDEAMHAQFKYLLFKAKSYDSSSIPLDRFVFFEKTKDYVSYGLRLPTAGRYKMDIFGWNPNKHETIDLVCSYLVECDKIVGKIQPLPDSPEIGWGPGAEAERAGIRAKSHEQAVVDTQDGHVELRFAMDKGKAVLQNLRSNELDEWLLSRYAVIREEDGDLVINARLPEQGEYALKMFADEINQEGEIPNVCNYLLRCLHDNVNVNPFPKLHEGMLGKSYLAKSFHVKARSHKGGLINTPDGKLQVDFSHKDSVELCCEIHHNDVNKTALADGIDKKIHGHGSTFDIELPCRGEYAMNVYARKKGEEDRVYHVHTYLIQSDQTTEEKVTKGAAEVQASVLTTMKDEVEVRVPILGDQQLRAELTRKNAHDLPIKNQVQSYTDGESQVFKVKLSDFGEYKLDVFEEKEGGGIEHSAAFFLVKEEPESGEEQVETAVPEAKEEELTPDEKEKRRIEKEKEAKEQVLKNQLKMAISSQDMMAIRRAIKECEENNMADNSELKRGRQLLTYLQISQELNSAMASRDLATLERAIDKADKTGLQKRLGLQLQAAQRMLEHLQRIEKAKSAVMKMNQKTTAEIKSYSKPPEVVHTVMSSTYMILGEPEAKVKDWKAVQVLIGKTGKESFKRKVSEFNVDKLKIEVAKKVKRRLEKHDLLEVSNVSAGASTFYLWSMGMIEEAESRFAQKGRDLAPTR